MKKYLIIYIIAACVLATTLSLLTIYFVRDFYDREIATVQNIAGAVLTAHPEAEREFTDALADEQLTTLEPGATLLSRYGYDANQQLKYNNPAYLNRLYTYLIIIAAFWFITLACGIGFYQYFMAKRRRQEESITLLLENYLDGDYNQADNSSHWQQMENSHFGDNLKKLGKSLQLQTERLNAEQNNTKTLVTDISHQLKTPISALKTCFSMYLESDDEKERAEFLQRSLEQMNKLESLTTSLVNISRLENQMITINPQPTELRDIIINAVNTVYQKASGKQITINTEDFDDLTLYLDPKWTAEAIVNILDNAVKYSPEGSQVNINIAKLYSFVRIEIIDQGIGIPKDEQNRIFSRFFRGSHPTVQNQEGSGVGLYLARKIMEDQSGTVSVQSAAHGGSIFVIQLPL